MQRTLVELLPGIFLYAVAVDVAGWGAGDAFVPTTHDYSVLFAGQVAAAEGLYGRQGYSLRQ